MCRDVLGRTGPARVLIAASDLAVAWILIRLVTGLMPNQALARGAANTVWTVAALHVFGLLRR